MNERTHVQIPAAATIAAWFDGFVKLQSQHIACKNDYFSQTQKEKQKKRGNSPSFYTMEYI